MRWISAPRSDCSASGTPRPNPSVCGRTQSRELPVPQMRREAQRRLAVGQRSMNSATSSVWMRPCRGCDGSKSQSASRCTYSPATRPRFSHSSFSRALCQALSRSGKGASGCPQPDPMHRQQRADRSGHGRADRGRSFRAQTAHQREQRQHDAADDRVPRRASGRRNRSCPGLGAPRILPNTSRRASRSTPVRKSSSGWTKSITGPPRRRSGRAPGSTPRWASRTSR